MKRRQLLQAAGVAASLAAAIRAGAAAGMQGMKITHGHTATTDFVSLFAAVDKGMFAKGGLEVQLQLNTINSTLPAALQAGSLQIAGLSSTVFLQAVDAGLDQVVLGGGGSYGGGRPPSAALLARVGTNLQEPKDLMGKKIGIPGLGGTLHVTFRAWLIKGGVDPKQVRFVEMPFAQQADVLKGGSVDGVVSVDPFLSRVIENGAGYLAANFSSFMPDGLPTTLHCCTRDWAEKNRGAVSAFRQGIVEGAAFANDPGNDAAVRALVAKYNRVPAEVLPKIIILKPCPVVTAAQLDYWAALMGEQGMLRKKVDGSQLIFPA